MMQQNNKVNKMLNKIHKFKMLKNNNKLIMIQMILIQIMMVKLILSKIIKNNNFQ